VKKKNNSKKTYIYVCPPSVWRANSQILAQYDGGQAATQYFYLHDRLGSVREVINTSGNVVRLYTYSPFGEVIESSDEPQATSNKRRLTSTCAKKSKKKQNFEKVLT